MKMIGALCVILGCGGYGLIIAANHRNELRCLRQLLSLLDFMGYELQYRYTPLPDLCRQVAAEAAGKLKNVFLSLSIELEDQISPDVSTCMEAAISANADLPVNTKRILTVLGRSIGRFDIEGQLFALENVRNECRTLLNNLAKNQESKLHSYQTLGVCAGAAIAIVLI